MWEEGKESCPVGLVLAGKVEDHQASKAHGMA